MVQPPPRGTLLMIHAGALYFCAQPLHLVLADYAPQESRAPVPSRSHCANRWRGHISTSPPLPALPRRATTRARSPLAAPASLPGRSSATRGRSSRAKDPQTAASRRPSSDPRPRRLPSGGTRIQSRHPGSSAARIGRSSRTARRPISRRPAARRGLEGRFSMRIRATESAPHRCEL